MIEITRRQFLKVSGSVLTTAGTGSLAEVARAADGSPVFASPAPEELDTWIKIMPNGQVVAFFGKMNVGLGVETAIAQVVAEELNMSPDRIEIVMGDTLLTPNQGGGSASSSIRWGAPALRNAAAQARSALLTAGAQRLGIDVADAVLQNGLVMSAQNPSKGIRIENIFEKNIPGTLTWNKELGNTLKIQGDATPKAIKDYQVVGQPVPRLDMHEKMTSSASYLTNVRVPGMLHARAVRPTAAGAVPAKVDRDSIKGIPGAQVFWKKDFLAVVAPDEWHAVRASRELKVEWTTPANKLPGDDHLHDYIRQAPVVASNGTNANRGKKAYDVKPVMAALAGSARVIEAEYEAPLQSHARMAGSIGIADVRNGAAVIYTDTQKPHFMRDGIAQLLGYAPDKVRVIWRQGAGNYGRSDADEAAFEAAVISQELGKPVRMQWMRHEGIAWDPKAPAAVVSLKAGLTSDNKVGAYSFHAKALSGWDVKFSPDAPEHTLVGMLLGYKKSNLNNFDTPEESYQFPSAVAYWETVPPLQQQASPLRTAHMRAPQEMQTRFANESFIDEVALAAGQDPLQFRLQHLKNPREIAVLKAAAERAGWVPGQAPKASRQGDVLRGRGIALYTGYDSHVAVVADVEVNATTGHTWVRHVTVALDCGLIVNPRSLHNVVEGGVMMGISRALFEEVKFDDTSVTSVDWASYPIADVTDAPEKVDIVLLNHPEIASGGAGEPPHVSVPAAIANAIANATGQRVRRYPMTPERVKAVL